MPSFYARPVFFVANAARAVRFYVDVLAFEVVWDRGDVAQVNRGDLELILCEAVQRAGQGRLFVELMPDELDAFRAEVTTRPIQTTDVHWGYPCWQIQDPDGNELLVCQDNDPSREAREPQPKAASRIHAHVFARTCVAARSHPVRTNLVLANC